MNGRSFNFNPGRQSGVFMVEFALIAPVIALVLAFATDMVGKQTLKGRLEVLSYSAVSLIKERTELYSESTDNKVDGAQANEIYEVVKSSMKRTMGDFEDSDMGYFLEQQLLNDKLQPTSAPTHKDGIDCLPDKRLADMNSLRIKTSWDRPVTLYQVTLCYRDSNSFGTLAGEEYSVVKASAIMLGR